MHGNHHLPLSIPWPKRIFVVINVSKCEANESPSQPTFPLTEKMQGNIEINAPHGFR